MTWPVQDHDSWGSLAMVVAVLALVYLEVALMRFQPPGVLKRALYVSCLLGALWFSWNATPRLALLAVSYMAISDARELRCMRRNGKGSW